MWMARFRYFSVPPLLYTNLIVIPPSIPFVFCTRHAPCVPCVVLVRSTISPWPLSLLLAISMGITFVTVPLWETFYVLGTGFWIVKFDQVPTVGDMT